MPALAGWLAVFPRHELQKWLARGFAHIGVLRVLEREGLRPDLVVGSSAGGIGLGLMAGERLEQFLRRHLDKPIESFALPFAAVATDMENAETVVCHRGDAAKAVRASCSAPVLYEPIRVRSRLHRLRRQAADAFLPKRHIAIAQIYSSKHPSIKHEN